MNINGLEIERKFLVAMPDRDILESADSSDIMQIYLLGEAGTTERIRKRTSGGKTVYTHTVKRRISSMTHIEDETEIGAEEFELLKKRADPNHHVVTKTRCCFRYAGELWELDIYPFWNDRAIMEVELRDEAQAVELPPFIRIIKEVTSDRRYSNAAISVRIPQDEIGR